MTDTTVEIGTITDEPAFDRFGKPIGSVKRVPFFIGKHGPFTERIPADANWELELQRRIEALKQTLQRLNP